MKTLDTKSKDFRKSFAPVLNRTTGSSGRVTAKTVADIVAKVRKNGDKALFAYTKKFDKVSFTPRTIRVSPARMKTAEKDIPPKLKSAIKTALANIKRFHKMQVEKGFTIKTGKSSKVGQKVTPLKRVGLYVPGGSASYPSSVLMNAIPAIVAGVKDIVICSPAPNGITNPAVIYAAALCGITEFYKVGGAQAIAAMAYGTKTIKQVDKITGPGNAYVAEAKRQVFGQVDIDMIAGPSELLVIADSSANPAWAAADLLAQAEHDILAWPILLATSTSFIKKTVAELLRQVEQLDRKNIAKKCLAKRFYAVKTASINEAISLANEVAIEHLELAFNGAEKAVNKITNAGAIFVGHYSAEVLGDYIAGPNHVLPTSGSARFFSPLGVYDFVKRTSIINYSKADFAKLAEKTAVFADSEGLDGHARASRIR